MLSRISHTESKVKIGNNQSRSPLWNIILSSCSVYLHLFEIAMYLWFGSIRGTTKFQFTFRSKITRNYIFEVTSCRRIILIFALLEDWQSQLVFGLARNALSLKQEMEGVLWRDQTTAKKETTVSVTPMHFILTWKYFDNRSHNICVSSDKIGFFPSICDIFVFWELCSFWWEKWNH